MECPFLLFIAITASPPSETQPVSRFFIDPFSILDTLLLSPTSNLLVDPSKILKFQRCLKVIL